MNIFQIVVFAVISCIIAVLLKSIGSELYTMVLLASGIVVMLFAVQTIGTSMQFFKQLYETSGIDGDMIMIIVKCVVVAYLVDFGVGVCEDMGLKSFSDKIVLSGKAVIFAQSLPVLKNIFGILNGVLGQ